MIDALQWVKEQLKKFSEFQVENEAMTSVMPVRCSNH